MPLPNRVTPFGELVADPARGLLLGNRGPMFHDPATRTLKRRRWSSARWLCCSLAYPGRHRHPVWSRGYTQLFFLDEVTALAAGHRPCAECRRREALAFRDAAARGSGRSFESLPALDACLHAERLDRDAHRVPAGTLPDGTVWREGDGAFALRRGRRLAWSHRGWNDAGPAPDGLVAALTPPTSVAALRAGYAPVWHPTATITRPGAGAGG